jgi:hypothetical protein
MIFQAWLLTKISGCNVNLHTDKIFYDPLLGAAIVLKQTDWGRVMMKNLAQVQATVSCIPAGPGGSLRGVMPQPC